MSRNKQETLGSLGRSPARTGKIPKPSIPPPIKMEEQPPPPDPGRVRRWLHSALFDNVGLKFLSMVLAITVFLLVNTDRDREITARIGVSYTLPDDKVLMSDRIEEVRVTVKGPWQRLRRFDQREVDRINLDLRRASSGEVTITPDMIHLPSGLTISQIEPRTIRVAFDRRVEKIVEVTAQISGRPQHGYVISEVKPAPTTVKIRGAETTLAALSAIHTREVSFEGRSESFVAETEVSPPDGVDVEGSPQVVLHVAVDEELVTRKLPGLVVGVRGEGIDPAKWTVAPAQIEVTLTGALLAVEKAKAAMVPVVKITTGEGKPHDVDVVIDGLPPGIGVKISPERVKVSPAKPAPPTQ